MSGDRSAFRDLKPDRRAIRLADGKVVYSEGLGSIRFPSDCGYAITSHDAVSRTYWRQTDWQPDWARKAHRVL
jgi:hypothetical protein